MQGLTPTVAVRRRAHVARIYPTPAQGSVLHRQGHTARRSGTCCTSGDTCRLTAELLSRPSMAEIDRQLRAPVPTRFPAGQWLAELPCPGHATGSQPLPAYAGIDFTRSRAPAQAQKRSGRLAAGLLPQASQLCVVPPESPLAREVTIPLVRRVRFRWTRPLPGVSQRRARADHRRPADQGSTRLVYLRSVSEEAASRYLRTPNRQWRRPGHGPCDVVSDWPSPRHAAAISAWGAAPACASWSSSRSATCHPQTWRARSRTGSAVPTS